MDVFAGPIEASVLGNVGCQLMALDQIRSVAEFRQLVVKSFPLKQFKNRPHFMPASFLETKWHELCALH